MQWLILMSYFCFSVFASSDAVGTSGNLKGETGWLERDENNGNWQDFGRSENDHRYKNDEGNGRNVQAYNQDYAKCTEKNYDNGKYGNTDGKFGIPGLTRQKDGSFYNEEERIKLDKIFGYTGPTANDEPENLVHPCAFNDWQCIRHYFADNSDCNPAYGPIPDPLTLDLLTIFFSSVNMTITFPNIVIMGLSSAKVKEFYINKKSGNLVLALDVQNLNETSQRAYYRYRRTAKESIILADYATVNFRSVTFTAVIPKASRLRLDLADVHVDSQDGFPAFTFGPGASNSSDPDVISAGIQIPVLLPVLVREGLLFNSQQLTAIFIQKAICDFGLKLISV